MTSDYPSPPSAEIVNLQKVSSGGNQREQDRVKAQKKAAAQKKPKESAASLARRKEA